jgi:endo-1,4-beta-D-glucanase Y
LDLPLADRLASRPVRLTLALLLLVALVLPMQACLASGTGAAAPSGAAGPRAAPPDAPAVPFGSHRFPYRPGTLRPSGSQASVDAAVARYHTRWKAAFVRQNCGNGWYEVISPDADHPYVAEAQGYGLVISATMAGADPDAKRIFDGILAYVLAHPSVNNPDLHAAEQDSNCRSVNGSDSATDGDLDIAYGLLLADRQWGSSGRYDYRQLAVRRINAIKRSEVHPGTRLMLLGDWSTPGGAHYTITRTSDWLIDHFRAFRTASGDAAWDTIRNAHQSLIAGLQSQYAPNTGLLPDFVQDTGTSPPPTTATTSGTPAVTRGGSAPTR